MKLENTLTCFGRSTPALAYLEMQSRGSIETGDLITDVTGQPLNVSFGGISGKVHSGAMSAATYVQCCTRSTLQKAARDCPGWPLLIAGHSLGGRCCCSRLLRIRVCQLITDQE